MNPLTRTLLCWGILSSGCPLVWSAQSVTPQVDLPEVTVIAPRPVRPEELAGEAVPNFISAHVTPSMVTHELTRWRTGVCPTTQGLQPAFDAFVSARIEAVAVAVGAPRQTATPCAHNVQIIFTTEPQKLLDEISQRDPKLLGFHYAQQTQKLATFSHAIQGWYITSTRNYAGVEVTDDAAPLPSLPGVLNAGKVPPGKLGSRLTTGLMSTIVGATIVVDAKKVTGMTIESVSDYIAMFVLSQSKSPETCSELPSIVDVMASNCAHEEKPDQLTAGDLAFLRALYTTNMEQPIFLEISDIQNTMMSQFSAK